MRSLKSSILMLSLAVSASLLIAFTASFEQALAKTNKKATHAKKDYPFILLIYCSGGWDPTMVFDSKIGEADFAQETGAVLVEGPGNLKYVDHANRPSVKNFFNTYGEKAVIINGVYTQAMHHGLGARSMLGSTAPNYSNRAFDWLSYYVSFVAPGMPLPQVTINAPFFPGPFGRYAVKLPTVVSNELVSDIPNANALSASANSAVHGFLQKQYGNLLESHLGGEGVDNEKLLNLAFSFSRYSRAKEILTEINAALPTGGGDSEFLRNAKVAVELFTRESAQTATIQYGNEKAWDTHSDHYSRQAVLFEELFSDLNKLLEYATQKELSEQMIVLVLSDVGRSSALNDQSGKDHWPYTSVLAWGSMFRGSETIGKTDNYFTGVPMNIATGSYESDESVKKVITMKNVMTAIYVKFKIPYSQILPDVIALSPILRSGT